MASDSDSSSGKRKSGRHKPTRRIADIRPAFDPADPVPALRSVPAEMVSLAQGKKGQPEPDEMGIVLHDPDGFASDKVVLAPGAYALATLFDGDRSAKDIATLFREQYGQEVSEKGILELAGELDKACFLESPRFDTIVRETIERYIHAPVRPAAHGGDSYPANPDELLKYVEGFFTEDGGPGKPDYRKPASDQISGIILPHIDLRVGGATYAHGYKALLEACQADLFVILGVAHRAAAGGFFNVSHKDYATPFGPVRTSKGIARRLQDAAKIESAIAEYTHKDEHSVEFQTVLLAGLLGQQAKREFEIVPILCNSADPYLEEGKNPAHDEEFQAFIDCLRGELDKSGRKWCIMASVDLSHVGPKFGHATNMTEKLLLPVERADRRMLKKIETLDPDAFYFEFARTKPPNSRHVDAVLAVLALLAAGKGKYKEARLLHYDQMLEVPTKSAVSYASLQLQH